MLRFKEVTEGDWNTEPRIAKGWWVLAAGLVAVYLYGQANGGVIRFGSDPKPSQPVYLPPPAIRPPPAKPVRVIQDVPTVRVPESELARIQAMRERVQRAWNEPDGPNAYRFADGPNRGIVRLPQE